MSGVAPPAKAPYQMSHEELKELKVQLEELLAKKYIKPNKLSYGAHIFFIHKKDRTLRMCVDYKAFNKVTMKNRYPLPQIYDLFDRLSGVKVFNRINLCSKYYQIRIIKKERRKGRLSHKVWLIRIFSDAFWTHQCTRHILHIHE